MKRKTNLLVILGLATLLGFPALGYVLLSVADEPLSLMWRSRQTLPLQVLWGSAAGVTGGLLGVALVSSKFMLPVREKYGKVIGQYGFKPALILFISLCAGIGEELFFRGAVQPLAGIWITAIVFVAIHGYLNPFDWRIFVYGCVLTAFIAGLGYLTEYSGIWAAVVAHALYDIFMFALLARFKPAQTTVYEN